MTFVFIKPYGIDLSKVSYTGLKDFMVVKGLGHLKFQTGRHGIVTKNPNELGEATITCKPFQSEGAFLTLLTQC